MRLKNVFFDLVMLLQDEMKINGAAASSTTGRQQNISATAGRQQNVPPLSARVILPNRPTMPGQTPPGMLSSDTSSDVVTMLQSVRGKDPSFNWRPATFKEAQRILQQELRENAKGQVYQEGKCSSHKTKRILHVMFLSQI